MKILTAGRPELCIPEAQVVKSAPVVWPKRTVQLACCQCVLCVYE
jgi:hypothetical protein